MLSDVYYAFHATLPPPPPDVDGKPLHQLLQAMQETPAQLLRPPAAPLS
jgi:hypothetical protein